MPILILPLILKQAKQTQTLKQTQTQTHRVVAGLLADIPKLTAVLTHHVVGTSNSALKLADATLTTLGGNPLVTKTKKDVTTIGSDVTVKASIKCGNGYIHVIDKVMMPPAPAA